MIKFDGKLWNGQYDVIIAKPRQIGKSTSYTMLFEYQKYILDLERKQKVVESRKKKLDRIFNDK